MAISVLADGTFVQADTGWLPGALAAPLLLQASTYSAFIEFTGLPPVTPDLIATAFTLTFDVVALGQAGTISMGVVVNRIAPLPTTALAASPTVAAYTTLFVKDLVVTSTGTKTISASGTDAALSPFNHGWRNNYRDSNGAIARNLIVVLYVKPGRGHYSNITFQSATLSVTETSARTGIVGHQYVRDEKLGIASGMVECHKSGRWVPADEAVIDGYTRMPVHRDEYDPPERFVGRKRPRPTSLEK